MGRRPSAFFVGNALGLDFLNSIATPVDTPIDWIDDGEGLLSWLEQAQLVPPEALGGVPGRTLFRANSTRWQISQEFARVVQRLCAPTQGTASDSGRSCGVGAVKSTARTRRNLQPDNPRSPGQKRALSASDGS